MYDEIYAAWKHEKDLEEIQPLPRDFFRRASEYIARLKLSVSELSKESDIRSVIEHEIRHAEFMLLNLLRTRARKIILSPLDSERISPNLLEDEHTIVDDLSRDLRGYLEQPTTLSSGLEEIEHQAPYKEADNAVVTQKPSDAILLRILQPIPKLVGADLDEYGPFQQEDLVVLPRENALILIARGAALEIRSSSH